jgi:hypothetical protein
MRRACHAALGAERRNEGGQHDEAGVDHQLRHFGHAADVFHAIGFGEAEVLVQPVAHVVAVEQVGVASQRVQALFDLIRQRRLAGARQAGEPQHAGPLPLHFAARRLVHIHVLHVDVVRPAQREAAACRRRWWRC